MNATKPDPKVTGPVLPVDIYDQDPDVAVSYAIHSMVNLRIIMRVKLKRRVKLHLVLDALGGIVAVWLVIVHLDIMCAVATSAPSLLAEMLDRLFDLG